MLGGKEEKVPLHCSDTHLYDCTNDCHIHNQGDIITNEFTLSIFYVQRGNDKLQNPV